MNTRIQALVEVVVAAIIMQVIFTMGLQYHFFMVGIASMFIVLFIGAMMTLRVRRNKDISINKVDGVKGNILDAVVYGIPIGYSLLSYLVIMKGSLQSLA